MKTRMNAQGQRIAQWHGEFPVKLKEALRLAKYKQDRPEVAIVIEALTRYLGVKV